MPLILSESRALASRSSCPKWTRRLRVPGGCAVRFQSKSGDPICLPFGEMYVQDLQHKGKRRIFTVENLTNAHLPLPNPDRQSAQRVADRSALSPSTVYFPHSPAASCESGNLKISLILLTDFILVSSLNLNSLDPLSIGSGISRCRGTTPLLCREFETELRSPL